MSFIQIAARHLPSRREATVGFALMVLVVGGALALATFLPADLGINRVLDGRTLAIVVTVVSTVIAIGVVVLFLAGRRQTARQRETEEAARSHLQAAINAVPVEFVEYDKDRRLVRANQAARSVSPWRTPGAASGKTIDEVMVNYISHFATPETEAAWKAWCARSIEDFDRGGVAELYRPDGQWRRSYVSDMPGGGRVVVRVDIGAEKENEARMAADMGLLRSIFESTGAGILMLDRDLRVVLANQFVLDVQGTTVEGITGRLYSELPVTGFPMEIVQRWQAAAGPERLKAIEVEHSVVVADGRKRIFRTTANPVQDEGGYLSYIVLIGVDDTERRLGEIRLFNSSRLANLGEMATGMAHEINQPLAVIRMAAESLLEEFDMPEARSVPAELLKLTQAKLGRITTQAERAAKLVDELRTISRRPADDDKPFDVADAARVADDLLHEQLKAAGIYLTLDLPPPGVMARGAATRLQQVIINLVLNARDALLEVKGRPASGPLGHIYLRIARNPAGGAAISIEDDGPGIPDHVLPRLFEPFFTTKPTGKGKGLGLSISYDIIKGMGGEIIAENRRDGGARFRIELPVVELTGAGSARGAQ